VVVHREQPQRCVATCRAFLDQGVPLQIVVVDNGSSPAAVEHIRGAVPDALILETGVNHGFGPGANVGLRRWLADGAGEWAVVAPHDALPEPECLRRLLDAATARPRSGLVSAEYGHGGTPVVDRYFGGILAASDRRPGWEDAGHPHGTLLLARRQCLEEVGLFDERYFAYCEEADLGVRARRAGWEVGIVWGAVVLNPAIGSHHAAVDYLKLRNTLLLVREHSGWYPSTIRLLMAIGTTAWFGVRPARRPPLFSLRGRVLAMAHFLRGRFGPPPATLLIGG
jgi:GT2 family glycosyltransferase